MYVAPSFAAAVKECDRLALDEWKPYMVVEETGSRMPLWAVISEDEASELEAYWQVRYVIIPMRPWWG